MSSSKSILVKLTLFVISLLFALGMLELGLRLASPARKLSVAQQLVTADERGHTIHKKNLDIAMFSEEQQKEARIKTNSEGYVGNDYAVGKSPGTQRIAVLGDSFVAALQVDSEKNFVSLLEKELSSATNAGKCSSPPLRGDTGGCETWEVMNFGVGGQGTMEEILRYHYYVQKYQSDEVFLIFYPNDFENNQYYLPVKNEILAPGDGWKRERLSEANNNQSRTDWKFKLLKYSYLVRKLDNIVRQNATLSRLAIQLGLQSEGVLGKPRDGIHPSFFIYQTPLPEDHRTVFEFTIELFTLLDRVTKENRSRLTVVYLPEAVQIDEQIWKEKQAAVPALSKYAWDLNQPQTHLQAELEKRNINFLNLAPVLKNFYTQNPSSPLYNGREGHLSEEGHKRVAEILERYITTRN